MRSESVTIPFELVSHHLRRSVPRHESLAALLSQAFPPHLFGFKMRKGAFFFAILYSFSGKVEASTAVFDVDGRGG